MTDMDRNIRTLVVCFVLALMGLIPMRLSFGSVIQTSQVQVLGDSETVEGDRMEIIHANEVIETVDDESNSEEVVLPNAEVIETEE